MGGRKAFYDSPADCRCHFQSEDNPLVCVVYIVSSIWSCPATCTDEAAAKDGCTHFTQRKTNSEDRNHVREARPDFRFEVLGAARRGAILHAADIRLGHEGADELLSIGRCHSTPVDEGVWPELPQVAGGGRMTGLYPCHTDRRRSGDYLGNACAEPEED
jgi:hypothetical protein